jgi:hypothetical protein
MIRYNLDIQPDASKRKIHFTEQLLFMGSCFSEHIAAGLSRLSFYIAPSPLGTVFNPVSLARPFVLMDKHQQYTGQDLVSNKEIWYSKFHHGVFSNMDKSLLLDQVNKRQEDFESTIRSAAFLFITFGSAWIYSLNETNEIVANCHKIPQSSFTKSMLEPGQIVDEWSGIIANLKRLNPSLQIVFTVSPVKHLRDGVHENIISKSVLLLSVEQLRRLHPEIHYFPAYELVNEDLRDYRFYESDGAHPNQEAVKYVFEKFKQAFMDEDTMIYIRDMEKLLQLKSHRPGRHEGPEYEQYLTFIKTLEKEMGIRYGLFPDAL